jgi:hypothetical protein
MKPIDLRHAFARLKGLRRHGFVLVYPVREWALGILLGIALLIGGGVYAALMFTNATMRAVDDTEHQRTESPSPYRQEEVRRTLQLYEDRARRFEELRGDVPPPAPVSSESADNARPEPAASIDATPVAE